MDNSVMSSRVQEHRRSDLHYWWVVLVDAKNSNTGAAEVK